MDSSMKASDVVKKDVAYMVDNLNKELIKLSGSRLLLTGGAGFLGYYLVHTIVGWNRLRDDSALSTIDLVVCDNFMRGLPNWLSDFESEGLLTVKKHDVLDPLPQDIGEVSYIIHAASVASPIYYRKYPIETMDANVKGLRHLLEFFKKRNDTGKFVGGLLYFSTSEIYGDPDPLNIPTSEDYRGNVSCTGPRACYDESKRFGETLCVNFAQQYGLPIKIARPFNNYGPGLKITDGRALPDFCKNVLAGDDIVMLSDGAPTRTFCYVADAIIGYFKVLAYGRSGEPYNIGTEQPEISIKKLAEMVIDVSVDIFGYDGGLIYQVSSDKEYLTDNPNRRCPLIGKAREELGYNPSINIREGLERSLLWYKDNSQGIK